MVILSSLTGRSAELTHSLIVAAYVLIAAAVTMHALLKKSDVRATLGWIALAWFSPIFGGFLYYAFGINRVTRRALKLKKPAYEHETATGSADRPAISANIATLADISLRVTRKPLTAGNSVAVLHGGDEAYPAMLAAIRGARRSIALASYILRYDAVGQSFVDALSDARRRGVAVRVLLDGVGSNYILPATLRHLKARQVPVARFLHTWVPWRMPFLNMRNHKKLLIVDGEIGFTGGLNIGAENSARLSSMKCVDDVHVHVEGPIVEQLMYSFARDWSFTTDEILDKDIWWPPLRSAGPVFARGIPSGPDADLYKLETVLGAALGQARTRVRIVTPYFLPDQRLEFAIAQAGLRGVAVEILIPERCDYVFVDWAMRAHLRFFQDMPANVYLSPAPFDHAKLMTVDGEWCLVGSSNWDMRSLRLNFEFDLEFYDKALATEIDGLIDRKIAKSRQLRRDELASRPKWKQLRDAAIRLMLPYL
ncbi:MAG: phospholipase D-like domain-containing protein [Rhizomicrobium sp.]